MSCLEWQQGKDWIGMVSWPASIVFWQYHLFESSARGHWQATGEEMGSCLICMEKGYHIGIGGDKVYTNVSYFFNQE